MPAVATQGDCIRIMSAGAEVEHLHAVGTLHGIAVRQVSAACGEGVGVLSSDRDGEFIAWKAPGSSAAGTAIDVSDGGQFLLNDGEDSSKWIRIEVYPAFLIASSQTGEVTLSHVYNNAIASDNVSAAEASAGDVETWTVTLQNDSTVALAAVTVWLDASTSGIEISHDGSTWVNPTSEGSGLNLGNLSASGTVTLHFRRTISAGASHDPDVTTLLHYAFSGI